jgi:hypothetical protein
MSANENKKTKEAKAKAEVEVENKAEEAIAKVKETEFTEAPESLAPHYGELGFQKLLVAAGALTVGGGTHSFIAIPADDKLKGEGISLHFQDGIPAEVGVNGLSNETVLRAVLNRLRAFQKGEFACEENAQAINRINDALSILCKRTADRKARGVEGTLKK